MRTRTRLLLGGLVIALVLAGGTAYLSRDRGKPDVIAEAYLRAWEAEDYRSMQSFLSKPGDGFAATHRKVLKDLTVVKADYRLGRITQQENRASAIFRVEMDLRSLGSWTYDSRLDLVRSEDAWKVNWRPQTIHPKFKEGSHFVRTRAWLPRAEISAASGEPITEGLPAVTVGIQPGKVQNREQLAASLGPQVGVDPKTITDMLNKPGIRPDWFLPVTDLREERYQQIRPAIYDIPGVVFKKAIKRLPPTEEFARQLLGKVGEATRDKLDELGEPYVEGDQVGLFGLEEAFEEQLAGEPSGEIKVVAEAGTEDLVHVFPGRAPQPVKTTLEIRAQNAADAALAGVVQPAAIVVVDTATSEIRAVASRPIDQFNRAMTGKYAPGSTFKVVTAAGLLASGVTADQKVDCPPEATAGGRKFNNFESKGLGGIDFATAFIKSCNSAFVNLVGKLETDKLTAAAGAFGFESPYSLPVGAAGGNFPSPKDDAEKAAAALGQARVQASPMHMATVAAAVASGSWRPPGLIAGNPPPEAKPLDPAVAQTLQTLMRAVVEEGTGVRAKVPGDPISGKTGTAEFGRDEPPKTHAWFIGFRQPYAFAILVEEGGVGGEVAAPIAARLLEGLSPAPPPPA